MFGPLVWVDTVTTLEVKEDRLLKDKTEDKQRLCLRTRLGTKKKRKTSLSNRKRVGEQSGKGHYLREGTSPTLTPGTEFTRLRFSWGTQQRYCQVFEFLDRIQKKKKKHQWSPIEK